MKHKMLVLFLLICLLIPLSACGSGTTAVPSVPTQVSGTAVGSESQIPTAPEGTAAPNTFAETEETGKPDGSNVLPDPRGSWTGDVYTNERFGFRMTLPEGWLRSNDYQLARDNYLIEEAYRSTDVSELVREKGQLIVLKMGDYKGSYTALGVMPAFHFETPVEDTDIIWAMQEALTESFQKESKTVKLYEAVPLRFGDQEKAALHVILEQNGKEIEEYRLWFRDDPDFWSVLNVVTYSGLDLQPILDGISLLDPTE